MGGDAGGLAGTRNQQSGPDEIIIGYQQKGALFDDSFEIDEIDDQPDNE